MKLYFNFKGNYIVAKHNGVIIDMRTGIPTDATLTQFSILIIRRPAVSGDLSIWPNSAKLCLN